MGYQKANTKRVNLYTNNGVNLIVNELLRFGVSAGDRVGILLPRGGLAAMAICSTLANGSVYVPLNIKDAKSRISAIIQDAMVSLIIGYGSCPSYLRGFAWLDISILVNEESIDAKFQCSYLSSGEREAAILYTSGSTGAPKGVVLSHRAIKSFSEWAGRTFCISKKDRIASLAPITFDLSFFDIFTSIDFGAKLFFIPDDLTMNPIELTNWLFHNKISVWYVVPSMLVFWGSKGGLSNLKLPDLRTIMFAGEAMPTKALIDLGGLLPGVDFYNLFGPVETNVNCFWKVDFKRLDPCVSIPIGVPACNSQLKIDSSNNELLMKGPNLMSGYLVDGKYKLPLDEEGWFHTGDEVRINQYGEYTHVGRLDSIIKHFGYRIEPKEVEIALQNIPEVNECAVIGIKNTGPGLNRSELMAYIVTKGDVNRNYIKHSLKNFLPDYMIPTQMYVTKTCLPRLNNGKIDLVKVRELLLKKKDF